MENFLSVNPTHKPQRNSVARQIMLVKRRGVQTRRALVVQYKGPQFTPVPKTGWRVRVRLGEARKIA